MAIILTLRVSTLAPAPASPAPSASVSYICMADRITQWQIEIRDLNSELNEHHHGDIVLTAKTRISEFDFVHLRAPMPAAALFKFVCH